jgi:hypothetical protein
VGPSCSQRLLERLERRALEHDLPISVETGCSPSWPRPATNDFVLPSAATLSTTRSVSPAIVEATASRSASRRIWRGIALS